MRLFICIAAMLLAAGCATAQVLVSGDNILYGPGLTNNLIPQNYGTAGEIMVNDGLGHIYWGPGGTNGGGSATNVNFADTPSIRWVFVAADTNTFELQPAITNAWQAAADGAYAQATNDIGRAKPGAFTNLANVFKGTSATFSNLTSYATSLQGRTDFRTLNGVGLIAEIDSLNLYPFEVLSNAIFDGQVAFPGGINGNLNIAGNLSFTGIASGDGSGLSNIQSSSIVLNVDTNGNPVGEFPFVLITNGTAYNLDLKGTTSISRITNSGGLVAFDALINDFTGSYLSNVFRIIASGATFELHDSANRTRYFQSGAYSGLLGTNGDFRFRAYPGGAGTANIEDINGTEWVKVGTNGIALTTNGAPAVELVALDANGRVTSIPTNAVGGGTNVFSGDTNWITVYVGTNTYPIYGSEMFYSVTNHTGLTNNAAAAFGQDASYTNIGVEFVASNTITVIGLGCWIVSGNANDHIVSIYSGNTANPANLLGSVTINAGSLSSSSTYSNHFNYGLLASPVYVPSGSAYCILETTGGTDYYYTNSDVLSRTVTINDALLASSSAGYAYGSQISAGPVNALLSHGLIPGQSLVDYSVESNKLAKTSRQLITNSIVENTQDPGVWAKTGTNIMAMTENTNAHIFEIGSGLLLTPNSATSSVLSATTTGSSIVGGTNTGDRLVWQGTNWQAVPATGFTNLIAPQGTKLRGVNLVLRPWHTNWNEYYNDANFQSYITNDLALAKSLGFSAVRLIVEPKVIYTGALDINTQLADYYFFVRCAATNGLYVYAVPGAANMSAAPPTGAELLSNSNTVWVLTQMLATNANVLASDICQEIGQWTSDTEDHYTNFIGSLRVASKLAAPNLPVTTSFSLTSTNEYPKFKPTWILPYIDFVDLHFYHQFRHGDLRQIITNTTKPFIIGEFGVSDGTSDYNWGVEWAKVLRVKTVTEFAEHPQVEGTFYWALTDQSTTNSDKWGLCTTNSTLKTNSWVQKVLALPTDRNCAMQAQLSVTNATASIEFSDSAELIPPEQSVFFNFPYPVDVQIHGQADIDWTMAATNGYVLVTPSVGGNPVDTPGASAIPGLSTWRMPVPFDTLISFGTNASGNVVYMDYKTIAGTGKANVWPQDQTKMILKFTPQR